MKKETWDNILGTVLLLVVLVVGWHFIAKWTRNSGHPVPGPKVAYRRVFGPKYDKVAVEQQVKGMLTDELKALNLSEPVYCTDVHLMEMGNSKELEGVAKLSNGMSKKVRVRFGKGDEALIEFN